MGKCKNEVLLSKVGVNKIDKNMEVTFEVLNDLPDCKKIMTKNYFATTATTQSYNHFDRPQDAFVCKPSLCNNTGTLTLVNADANPTVSYKIPYDTRDYVAGLITMYVKKTASASANVSMKISDIGDAENYDVYTVAVAGEGFQPVVFDLSSTPSDTEGDGWKMNENGCEITITVPSGTGLSSIAVFDDISDFETTSVVKVGCLSEVGGTIDLDVEAASCWHSGYATNELPTIERTITGNSVTPNWWKLNPMMGKSKMVRSFIDATVEKELVLSSDGNYAVAMLPDAKEDECGFFGSNIADVCDFSLAQLERLTVPVGVDIDEKHFIIGDNPTGGKIAYYNKNLAGQRVMISYPKVVDVEERVANFENVEYVRCRMSYKTTLTDGAVVTKVFDNVLVTSFPDNITQEETEFSFTINIQPDVAGNYYREGRIIG